MQQFRGSYTGREVAIKRDASRWTLWKMVATACPMSRVRHVVMAAAIIFCCSVDKAPTERNIFSAPIYRATSETDD